MSTKATQLYIPEQPIPFPRQTGMRPDQKGSGKYHIDFAFDYWCSDKNSSRNYLFPVGMFFWNMKNKIEENPKTGEKYEYPDFSTASWRGMPDGHSFEEFLSEHMIQMESNAPGKHVDSKGVAHGVKESSADIENARLKAINELNEVTWLDMEVRRLKLENDKKGFDTMGGKHLFDLVMDFDPEDSGKGRILEMDKKSGYVFEHEDKEGFISEIMEEPNEDEFIKTEGGWLTTEEN